MQQGQIGGNIGPFVDPAMGGQVRGRLTGTFTFNAAGDVSAALPQVQARLMQTINHILGQKLASYQVAVQTMPGSLPYYTQEILSQCQTQDLGVVVTDLQLQLQLDAPAPGAAPQPYAGAMPPTPMQAMQNSFAEQAKERLDPSNYNIKAKIKVGGFNINASTDGGLDTDGLGKQAVDKVKSNVIWYAAGCLIVGLVLAGVAGIIIWAVWKSDSPASASAGKAAAWDGKSTFTCSGNDNVKLEKITANVSSGNAITASANCKLQLSNVNITAPVGIDASGNAKVTVTGGSVTGSEAAAKASGLAKITFSGTKVSGKTDAKKPATITGP